MFFLSKKTKTSSSSTLFYFFVFFFFLCAGNSAIAQMGNTQNQSALSGEALPQAQCFQMLKTDMKEAGVFSRSLLDLEGMTYADLQNNFSKKYKSLSFFDGLEINTSDIETRFYSFGAETGYKHPPLSPYPASKKSEVWDESVRQYIVVEEYVNEPGVGSRFVDCGFMSITASDLMQVKRENYYYDSGKMSLRKTSDSGSYRSWYSQFNVYGGQNKLIASWQRLFVYPKSTENDYFNKYDIADHYPANEIESYAILGVLGENLEMASTSQEYSLENTKMFTDPDTEVRVSVDELKPLQVVRTEPTPTSFPQGDYYDAIEASFPAFSSKLAVFGLLDYGEYKDILGQASADNGEPSLFEVLMDKEGLTAYYLAKLEREKDGGTIESPQLDRVLALLESDSVNRASLGLAQGTQDAPEKINSKKNSLGGDMKMIIFTVFVVLFIGALAFVVYHFTRKRKTNTFSMNRGIEDEESDD